MLGVLLKMGRWVGRLAVVALLFGLPGTTAHAGHFIPVDAGHHHDGSNADPGLSSCHHDGDGAQPQAGERAAHCVAAGVCLIAVPAEVSMAAEPPVMASAWVPASSRGVSLASVSPPQKPPRA